MSDTHPSSSDSPEASDDPEPSRPGLVVTVELQTHDTDPPLAGWLDVQLRRAAEAAGVSTGTLNLLVVDDQAMTQWHEQYTEETGTTDVLTFDLRDEPGVGELEGDLVLCVDEARRQAESREHDVRTEVLLYAVHGLMHLLGEDDHDPDAYQRMHRREDQLLETIGFGPVFHRSIKTS